MNELSSLHVDESDLIWSMLWSTVGGGFWIYGKKQRSAPPMFGGVAMIAVSFLISSALWMSVAEAGIIVGIYYWSQQD